MLARLGLSRPQLLLILVLSLVLIVMAVLQSQPETVAPYDPADKTSTGLAALVLWLEELGHPTEIGVPNTALPSNAGLLLIHPSNVNDPDYYPAEDVAATYSWVEQGGTLVLVGPIFANSPLGARFGVEQTETMLGGVAETEQVQPLLPDVPTEWNSFFAARSLTFTEDRAIVPVLAHTIGDPVVALQFIGAGVVWHLTEDFALTNLNLRDNRIASLLPAILRTVPAGAPALISTHHLASFSALDDELGSVGTLQDWLYTTPFGQATLLTISASFLYLLLQGRRLGPALPGPTASRPREAAEYVSALAGLQRRMRQPQVVAAHHRQRLKSAVSRLVHAPADMPDATWLAQLRRADTVPPTVVNEVTELLAGYAKVSDLRAKVNDETELIRLVQATDALLASLPRANKQLVR